MKHRFRERQPVGDRSHRCVRRCGLVALVLLPVAVAAQERPAPEEGGLVKSMGQPRRVEWYASASIGADFQDSRKLVGNAALRLFKGFLHPAYSIIGVSAEAYAGLQREQPDGGVRGLLVSPYLYFGAGADYSFLSEDVDLILSLFLPLRRGGVVGHGSKLRVDWLPTRDHAFYVGLSFPLWRPYAGKTRPSHDYIRFPEPQSSPIPHYEIDPALDETLANVRSSALWMSRLLIPYLDFDARTQDNAMKKVVARIEELKAHIASTGTIEAEIRAYHAQLDRAFSIAASERALDPGETTERGRVVAARAKEVLLEKIVLPYDRLLGRRKKGDTALYFGVFARGEFARWLEMSSGVPESRIVPVQYVFQELIDIIEENRKSSEKEWDDSRLTWLPLQYALLPEQHDSQKEIDDLVERAVGEKFTDGNLAWYIINESFQWEVGRMIREAEDYHVLWIHDFRGKDGAGDPDQVTAKQVIGAYLATLTRRVREYDETGNLPVYIIIQDQFYYENNKSRDWLALLEDPLHHEIDLPRGFDELEGQCASAQEELRHAVAASELLQTEAREYGEEWLRNRIKVHVNITNPSDTSFRSKQVVPLFGILDNVIRDHRKISFYDLTEEDPYKGQAIFSGMGIGEHYVGPTWEDRAVLAQGPAVLSLKKACRQVLLDQGFEEDEIPHPLRPRPLPPDYDEMILTERPNGGLARAVHIQNHTSYRPRPISVYKAMMYTLMPKGSVMITPDFVWHSPYWSSMLVGSALRGCRSFIILPSLPNQPSPSGPPMARSYEMFARLVTVQNMMAEEFDEVGGMLKTGFYDPDMDVKDIRARATRFVERLDQHEFLQELLDPHPEAYQALREVDGLLAERGFEVVHVVEDSDVRKPQLHLKAQFFASREAWEAFLPHPVMADVIRTYAVQRADQISSTDSKYVDPTRLQDVLNAVVRPAFTKHVQAMPPELVERIVWYISVGSQNQDYRGMFLDGEVSFITSGWESVWGLVDFVWILGMCDWVDDMEGVERNLGRYGWFDRRIGRIATVLM
jgi:hypothetical protein